MARYEAPQGKGHRIAPARIIRRGKRSDDAIEPLHTLQVLWRLREPKFVEAARTPRCVADRVKIEPVVVATGWALDPQARAKDRSLEEILELVPVSEGALCPLVDVSC